jgi:hypothetical protein
MQDDAEFPETGEASDRTVEALAGLGGALSDAASRAVEAFFETATEERLKDAG